MITIIFRDEIRNKKQQIIKQISHICFTPSFEIVDKFHSFSVNFSKVSKNGFCTFKVFASANPPPFQPIHWNGVRRSGKCGKAWKKEERRANERKKKRKRKKKKENGERKSMKRTFLANVLLIGIACKQSTEIFEGTESNGL